MHCYLLNICFAWQKQAQSTLIQFSGIYYLQFLWWLVPLFLVNTTSSWWPSPSGKRYMLTPWILKLHMNSAGTTHQPPLILCVTTCPTALNQTSQDFPWETVQISLWFNKGIVSQAHLCLTVLSCYMMSLCDTCRQHVCPTKPVR